MPPKILVTNRYGQVLKFLLKFLKFKTLMNLLKLL